MDVAPPAPIDHLIVIRAASTIRALTAKLRARGTHVVTSAMAVSGACSYGFLAVASRALDTADYARLAAAWAMVYSIETALFAPIARVLTRDLSVGQVRNDRATLAACARTGVLVLAAVVVPLLVASDFVVGRLLDGDWLLFGAVLLALPAQFFLDLAWGLSLGRMRFTTYGRLYAVDGVVRLGAALALASCGVRAPVAFVGALAAGPMFAVIWNRVWLRAPHGERPTRVHVSSVARSIRRHAFASALSVIMLSSSPLVVKSLAGAGRGSEAGRYLNALTVSQAPLMIATALLLVLLPVLTRLALDDHDDRFRAMTVRLLVGHAGLSVVAVAAAAAYGPAVVRLAYGPAYGFPSFDFALLVLAATLFLGAQLVAQVMLAIQKEGRVIPAFVAGTIAMAAVIAGLSGLLRRVELGFVAGTAVTYVWLLASLSVTLPRRARQRTPRRDRASRFSLVARGSDPASA